MRYNPSFSHHILNKSSKDRLYAISEKKLCQKTISRYNSSFTVKMPNSAY